MKRTLAIGVTVLALAGCGGDNDSEDSAATPETETQTVTRTETAPPPGSLPAGRGDEQEIQAVWRRYTTALGEEDGTTVCSLLTENGKKEVLRGGAAGGTCEETVEEIGAFFKGFETELTDIKVQGDVAEAVSPARGQIPKQGLTFMEDRGEWKIDRASDID